MFKKLIYVFILTSLSISSLATIAEAKGRTGSHRVGGYTSHGKGSHYVGGYVHY